MTVTMQRFILASAASFETDAIITNMHGRLADFTRIITGVGITETAMIAARTLSLVADRDVIFCCTAGSLTTFHKIELFSAQAVGLGSWDIRHKKTEVLSNFDPSIRLRPLDFHMKSCRVVCSLGISVSAENTTQNTELIDDSFGPIVESMELYAVARAWLPVARSFTAIVATTNETGVNARTQWQSNFRQAASETAMCVVKNLSHVGLLKEI